MIYSIYILINLVDRNRKSGESFPLMTKHRQLLVQLQVLMTLTVNNNQKGVEDFPKIEYFLHRVH